MSEILYVGNCRKQTEEFMYRIGKDAPVWALTLPPGTQARVPKDLSPAQVDYVIKQHAKYGIVAADAIDQTRGFHGICYSIGKPITSARLTMLMQANHQALVKQGEQIRRESAVAQNNMIEETLRDHGWRQGLTDMEITVQQENEDPKNSEPQFSEGFKVIRGGNETPSPRRGRRKAA